MSLDIIIIFLKFNVKIKKIVPTTMFMNILGHIILKLKLI